MIMFSIIEMTVNRFQCVIAVKSKSMQLSASLKTTYYIRHSKVIYPLRIDSYPIL